LTAYSRLATKAREEMKMKKRSPMLYAAETQGTSRRRFFREILIVGGAAVAAPRLSYAQSDYWEEGDPQCSIQVQSVTPAYPLDATLLGNFIALSAALTGISPLDPYLASDYLKRFASHPNLTTALPSLITAFREVSPDGKPPSDDVLRKRFLEDDSLRFAASQLIYLWYVSAFAIYAPADPKKQITWIYDEAEQYEKALLWSVVHAHAPMMHGGRTGHWSRLPRIG